MLRRTVEALVHLYEFREFLILYSIINGSMNALTGNIPARFIKAILTFPPHNGTGDVMYC